MFVASPVMVQVLVAPLDGTVYVQLFIAESEVLPLPVVIGMFPVVA